MSRIVFQMEWMDVPIVPISLPRELHADVKGRREFVMCVSNAARRGWSCSSLALSSSATTTAVAAAAVDMGGGATPSLASTQASRARTLSRTALRGLSCSDILLLAGPGGWELGDYRRRNVIMESTTIEWRARGAERKK